VHELLLERGAEKDLDRLAPDLFERVMRAIRGLSEAPRPPGSLKLTGPGGGRRIRVGDYRIIYEINERAREVRIIRVRHRREVYR